MRTSPSNYTAPGAAPARGTGTPDAGAKRPALTQTAQMRALHSRSLPSQPAAGTAPAQRSYSGQLSGTRAMQAQRADSGVLSGAQPTLTNSGPLSGTRAIPASRADSGQLSAARPGQAQRAYSGQLSGTRAMQAQRADSGQLSATRSGQAPRSDSGQLSGTRAPQASRNSSGQLSGTRSMPQAPRSNSGQLSGTRAATARPPQERPAADAAPERTATPAAERTASRKKNKRAAPVAFILCLILALGTVVASATLLGGRFPQKANAAIINTGGQSRRQYDTVDQALQDLTFVALVPKQMPDGYSLVNVSITNDAMLELQYRNGEIYLNYRVAQGSVNLGGNPEDYPAQLGVQSGDIVLTFAGPTQEQIQLAVWATGGRSFAIITSQPIPLADMQTVALGVG